MLQKNPDLGGIFGTNVFSAQGAGTTVKNKGLSGKVKVVAFDATKDAINMLKDGTVDLVIAQKPSDMGYLAVEMAVAYLNGVTSIPEAHPDRLRSHHPRQHERPERLAVLLSRLSMATSQPQDRWSKTRFPGRACRIPSTPPCSAAPRQLPIAFGADLVVQIPQNWNVTDQTPMLDAMVARGDLNFLFLAPVDEAGHDRSAAESQRRRPAHADRRYLHWRRRLRQRPGQVPAVLHRLRQLAGRTDRLPGPGGCHRQDRQDLHPERQARHQQHRCPRERLQGCPRSRVPERDPGGRGLQRR